MGIRNSKGAMSYIIIYSVLLLVSVAQACIAAITALFSCHTICFGKRSIPESAVAVVNYYPPSGDNPGEFTGVPLNVVPIPTNSPQPKKGKTLKNDTRAQWLKK